MGRAVKDLSLIFATLRWKGWADCMNSWSANAMQPHAWHIYADMPLLEAYQRGFEDSPEPILGYIHDDVVCEERNWDARVLKEFEDPTVGLVGFGGALGHGDPDMYRKPYELCQLARRGFRSNMASAEVHGERFTGECDVAVLDGFAMFVRRELLDICGGWPIGTDCGYWGYDYFISCITREHGYRIRLVGVAVDHLGGKSTGLNPSVTYDDFEPAHRWIYERFRNVLPAEVK
jgi:hypothetical protein